MLVYDTICAHMHKLCSLNLVTTKLALAMWLGSSSFSASQTIIDARVGPGLVMLLPLAVPVLYRITMTL